MAFFKAKIDGKLYQLDKLTLGQARVMKARFGLNDLEELNVGDPDHMVGILALCLHSERPAADLDSLIAEVEALDVEADFQLVAEEDPTQPADEAESADEEPTSETTPDSTGSPSGD